MLLSASKPAFSTTSTYTATTRQVTQATPKAASYSSAYTTPGTQGTNYSTGYTAAAAPTTNTTKGMCHWIIHSYSQFSGFGGLEVACWPLVPRVCGFKPGRSRRIFRAKKILSAPSFGGGVKLSVPCCSFTACKRSLNVTW